MNKDTHDSMTVFELGDLLIKRGFKLGGSCSESKLTLHNYESAGLIHTNFWFKGSALCALTYDDNDNTQLSYYAGNLTCIANCSYDLVSGHDASFGLNKYIDFECKLLHISKDIRNDLFELYDNLQDYIIDYIPLQDSQHLSYDTYSICNLVSHEQQRLSELYVKSLHKFDSMDFYRLFNSICFQENYKHFSPELQRVVYKWYIHSTDVIASDLSSFKNIDRASINKAYLWCKNMLKNQDITWKNII